MRKNKFPSNSAAFVVPPVGNRATWTDGKNDLLTPATQRSVNDAPKVEMSEKPNRRKNTRTRTSTKFDENRQYRRRVRNDDRRRNEPNLSDGTFEGSLGAGTAEGVDGLRLGTGIDAGIDINPQFVPAGTSPLFLAAGTFFNMTDTNYDAPKGRTKFDDELLNVYFPDYLRLVTVAVGRDVSSYFTIDKFSKFTHNTMRALQTYYNIKHILAYSSNTVYENSNYGIKHIRSLLDAEVLTRFQLLEERLETTCIHPHLLETIRFMTQCFKQADCDHSPIIKLDCWQLFDDSQEAGITAHVLAQLEGCIDDLNDTDVMQTNNYLDRAFPSWKNENGMPKPSNTAIYDIGFITFWRNMNVAYINANTDVFNYSKGNDELNSNLNYQVLQNQDNVDGLFTCMSSSFDIGSDGIIEKVMWGLWNPYARAVGKPTIPEPSDTISVKYYNATTGEIRGISTITLSEQCGIRNTVYKTTGSNISLKTNYERGWVEIPYYTNNATRTVFHRAMRYLFYVR